MPLVQPSPFATNTTNILGGSRDSMKPTSGGVNGPSLNYNSGNVSDRKPIETGPSLNNSHKGNDTG